MKAAPLGEESGQHPAALTAGLRLAVWIVEVEPEPEGAGRWQSPGPSSSSRLRQLNLSSLCPKWVFSPGGQRRAGVHSNPIFL